MKKKGARGEKREGGDREKRVGKEEREGRGQ